MMKQFLGVSQQVPYRESIHQTPQVAHTQNRAMQFGADFCEQMESYSEQHFVLLSKICAQAV
jgi:hypothetical protein